MAAARLGWGLYFIDWDVVQKDGYADFDFRDADAAAACLLRASAEPVACLRNCAGWASARVEPCTVEGQVADTGTIYSAPRNLWARGDSNYWTRYIRRVAERYPKVHNWEVWNEPNATGFWTGWRAR